MKTVHTIAELRDVIERSKHNGFVPTMGNLHAGHIDLISQARGKCDCVVSSIFVNRLQFGPNEDFDSYPRTFAEDCKKLEAAGCDILFAPGERDLYPVPQSFELSPPHSLAGILEGEFRPGFFKGVCTVVLKLFNCVQPRVAFFGRKDFQQAMIIEHMISQMALPIDIVKVPTRREVDGLAMSSRNGYLNDAERAEAVQLFLTLCQMRESFKAGVDAQIIEQEAMHHLLARGWKPDYLTIRNASDLSTVTNSSPIDADTKAADKALVILGAARIGKTRLIDNLEFKLDD
jgi:pantoate--beta-alanine ligase